MPFEKGHKKVGGVKKGFTNKSTENARQAIANLVDKNTPQMMKWLDQIAEESPEKAFDCMTKVMEYHLPKIARVEHTGKDGKEDIKHDIQVTFVTSAKDD